MTEVYHHNIGSEEHKWSLLLGGSDWSSTNVLYCPLCSKLN